MGPGRGDHAPAPSTARVYVLYTGGTFGMGVDHATPGGPLRSLDLDVLRASLPAAGDIAPGLEITLDSLSPLLDSSAMRPDDWVRIAERLGARYDDHDGFVVIQGTDTLAYTASALSFMLENLAKPVVVTGSQRPLTSFPNDAQANYSHALQIAGHKVTGLPCVPEVVVVFADKVLRGCRARKMSSRAWAGFESPNCRPLGTIGRRIRLYKNRLRPAPGPKRAFRAVTSLCSDVLDISLYPGIKAAHLAHILALKEIKGVLLRTFGAGNAPDGEDFLRALENGIKQNDKVVVSVTQCPHGTVEMGLYAASLGLMEQGVVCGFDMTPEAALTKLMAVLGSTPKDRIKAQMQISLRGEQSQNLFEFRIKKTGRPDADPFAARLTPTPGFRPKDLIAGSLRLKNLRATRIDADVDPVIDVFLDASNATNKNGKKATHRNHLLRIPLHTKGPIQLVEDLAVSTLKTSLGEGPFAVTCVPSAGVGFTFEALTLSLFTRA